MKNIITDSEFKELARKCQEGTASEEEIKAFDEVYDLLLQRHTTWDANLMGEKVAVQNEIYQSLINKVDDQQKNIRVFPLWKYLSAAVLLIVAGFSVYFFAIKTKMEDQHQQAVILPGKNNAILTLADGKKVNLNEVGNGALLKQAGIQITKSADGQLLYKVLNDVEKTAKLVSYNLVETPRGGQYQIILPDGTKVWLNAASSLKFPLSFASMEDRKVELKGEAYFEVTKDKIHPFKVINEGQEVKVLGTHFNINSYEDEGAIKTTLLEGSVIVTSDYAKNGVKAEVKIKPGEQAILTEKGINVVEKDVEAVMDWKNGDFIFQQESLKQIMNRVGRWYNVDVVYEKDVNAGLTFSGQMSRSKNIKEILKNLESTGEIEFEISGSKIKVKNNQ